MDAQKASPDLHEQRSDSGGDDREQFVAAHLKRNYLAHFLDGMLSFAGFRLISTPTFTPTYLYMLTGSVAMVGFGSALIQAGAMLSPIATAVMLAHCPRLLPRAVLIGWFMRLMILALALAGWFLSGETAVMAALVVLFLLGLGMGAQRVAFQLLLSKVIPIRRRGQLQGWRNFCGGIIAAGLSYIGGAWLIEHDVLGNGYASIFLLTFLLSGLGLTAIRLIMREPVEAPREAGTLGQQLRTIGRQFRNANFRHFLLAQATCTFARAAAPFYIIFAGRSVGLNGATIGGLALCLMAADTASNLVWGRIGDRSGYRVTFILSVLLWIASTILLLIATDPVLIYCAFAGIGAALSGYMMSQQTLVLELGSRDQVAARLGLSNMTDGWAAALGPAIGGLAVASFGYPFLFIASTVLLCATLALLMRVRDPRSEARA